MVYDVRGLPTAHRDADYNHLGHRWVKKTWTGGIVNGSFHTAFRAPGVETVAATLASELTQEGDSIALDNQEATKAILREHTWEHVVLDQVFYDIGYADFDSKEANNVLGPRPQNAGAGSLVCYFL